MQVRRKDGPAIAAGQITLAFRRWARPRVVAGRTYRTAAGRLVVTSIEAVDPATITDDEARAAGHRDAAALRSELPGDEAHPTYRIEIAPATDPDPRAALAATADLSPDDVAEIDRRLARLDAASSHGPWTTETLALIEAHPARRAPDLAAMVGRERDPFKLDVRKLKALGLTESLEVGYRLSPRGEAYLSRRADPTVAPGS